MNKLDFEFEITITADDYHKFNDEEAKGHMFAKLWIGGKTT